MSLLEWRQRTAADSVCVWVCLCECARERHLINIGSCNYWLWTGLLFEWAVICACELDVWLVISMLAWISLVNYPYFFLVKSHGHWFAAKCFYWLFDNSLWISTAGLLIMCILCLNTYPLMPASGRSSGVYSCPKHAAPWQIQVCCKSFDTTLCWQRWWIPHLARKALVFY